MKTYTSSDIAVSFDRARCLHAAECVRGLPEVFDATARPWITPDRAVAARIAEVIRRCPSGALTYSLVDGDPEDYVETRVQARPGEPIWVRGPVTLETPDGASREVRVALCACGATRNAPFCDSTGGCDGWRPGPRFAREE